MDDKYLGQWKILQGVGFGALWCGLLVVLQGFYMGGKGFIWGLSSPTFIAGGWETVF